MELRFAQRNHKDRTVYGEVKKQEGQMSIDRSDVRQDELVRHLRAVSAEVRLSGSPEEARAFDYIEGQLKGWGYTVNRYSCDAYTGYPQQAWLKMTCPDEVEYAANGYSLSP